MSGTKIHDTDRTRRDLIYHSSLSEDGRGGGWEGETTVKVREGKYGKRKTGVGGSRKESKEGRIGGAEGREGREGSESRGRKGSTGSEGKNGAVYTCEYFFLW